jgi:hypothetical protein
MNMIQLTGSRKCPKQIVDGKKTNYILNLKNKFGVVGLVPLPRNKRDDDIASRAEIGMIVGITSGKHGVKVYIPSRNVIVSDQR